MIFPIPLPHVQIRRILERNATMLIHTRQLRRDTYAIQDALIARRNGQRPADEWQDPVALMIEVLEVDPSTLLELEYTTIRASGFKTQRDFYDDWLHRHHELDPEMRVYACQFTVLEDAWYLHHATDGGLTRDPARAMKGEGQAVSPADLKLLGTAAARKREIERRGEITKQRARSLAIRLKAAAARNDHQAIEQLERELVALRELMRTVA